MDKNQIMIFIAMALYLLAVLIIGLAKSKRANQSSDDYFIGGRSLSPLVAAMSAEASDMSGWLLMGLPGVAYWCGLADVFWTALGLGIGTYLNWLIVSKRLRRYSIVAGNSVTLPAFFSNRYHEKNKTLLSLSSVFILIFFAVYVGSCFVTGGKLFGTLFGLDYHLMMLIAAAFVILYTLLGGFLAESVSDLMQGIVMVIALVVVLIFGVHAAGGVSALFANAREIPGFLEFFHLASPVTNETGAQVVEAGAPLFGEPSKYGFLTVLSTLSWGLGYFGMPQVLLRFMAIRKTSELGRSRRIAIVWCVISMAAAIMIGLIGRVLYPVQENLLTSSGAENVFVEAAQALFHPLVAGIFMSGILAAAMSSSDSYLLIAASAVSKNIYHGILKKNATDKQVMVISRLTLLIIAAFGVVIAWDPNSNIFKVVSFAWAGFGATFGPLVLFSLFWKRTTKAGAVAGLLSGAGMVFFYKLVVRKLAAGTMFDIYELLPAFLFSCLAILVVSLLTKQPDSSVLAEFDAAKNNTDEEIDATLLV
ncbi:MAG: sodium/proline symporter PutP [Oscillospiraceae bacterium]|jgi:sodium/proline symporter|nr:sodium/proline symporter PutP [Oscillospiraceae bacterium]